MSDLLDGRLPAKDAAVVRARIEAEPALREVWEDLQQVRALVREHALRGDDLLPPVDFLERVHRRIAAADAAGVEQDGHAQGPTLLPPIRSSSPPPARGRLLRLLTPVYAAAALVVVGLATFWVLGERAAQETTLTTAEQPGAADALGRGDVPRPARPVPAPAAEELVGRLGAPAGEPTPPAEAERRERPPGSKEAEPRSPADDAGPRDTWAPRGGFKGPGGAAPPGLRAPRDAREPLPSAPARTEPVAPSPVTHLPPADEPAPAPGERTDRAPQGEILLVFLARDAQAGRAAVERLLAGAMVPPDESADGDDPARAKARRGDAGEAPPALAAGGPQEGPAPVLYRVDALEGLARAAPRGEHDAAKGGPIDAPPGARPPAPGALVGEVERRLDAQAWRRLSARVAPAPWAQDEAGTLARLLRVAEAQRDAKDESAEVAAAANGQALDEAVKRRLEGAGTPEARAAPRVPSAPTTPAGPAAPGGIPEGSVRVRILILQAR